jgi:hypothetical protein
VERDAQELIDPMKTRRDLLKLAGLGAAALPFCELAARQERAGKAFAPPHGEPFQGTEEQLLDEIQQRAFDFFWNESSARTGQTKDRALANGNDARKMSSIAATGFGLTALCIGDRRGYRNSKEIQERVRTTLRFLANVLPNVHGFFYHFIDIETGARWEEVELSSIDTSLLLCGVLTARQYFADQEIKDLATTIYERIDWPWMMNGGKAFSMGWKPGSGFLSGRWERFCELMMIYLLGIGSPTHPVPASAWESWTRPLIRYQGLEFISGNDPIFTHQYSQAWFDFRNKRDAHTNYFENSIKATKAHKLFCLSLRDRFPDYSESLWGISASDYEKGYTAWGGPPSQGPIDGTIVPCATGGSLPFLFEDCMRVLRTLRGPYAHRAWTRYGFVDAFNPLTPWTDGDVLGIDQGITMVMAENQRTGFVWEHFMKNEEMRRAMQRAGFHAENTAAAHD